MLKMGTFLKFVTLLALSVNYVVSGSEEIRKTTYLNKSHKGYRSVPRIQGRADRECGREYTWWIPPICFRIKLPGVCNVLDEMASFNKKCKLEKENRERIQAEQKRKQAEEERLRREEQLREEEQQQDNENTTSEPKIDPNFPPGTCCWCPEDELEMCCDTNSCYGAKVDVGDEECCWCGNNLEDICCGVEFC